MTARAQSLRAGLMEALKADFPGLAVHAAPHARGRHPRLVVGTVESIGANEGPLREYLVSLHVWTRGRGTAQAQGFIDMLADWAEMARVNPRGLHVLSLRNIFWNCLKGGRGGFAHGVMRLRIVTRDK